MEEGIAVVVALLLVLCAILQTLNLRACKKAADAAERREKLLGDVLQGLAGLRGELVTAGIAERGARLPPAPGGSPRVVALGRWQDARKPIEVRIAERYAQLVETSEAAGDPAKHCEGGACFQGQPSRCRCACKGCVRATELSEKAHTDVMGRDPA